MKKFFKTFLTLALMGGVLTFTGCQDYEADINSLDDRLSAVEGTLKELKSKIEAGSVITGVESISNGVKVTLSDGKSFTLTNGKDGADGKDGANGKDGVNGTDGKDGSVITIGSNGNWFIGNDDTGLPAKGADGKDGANGTDGKDGADGIYYYPGSNGFWVKVDPSKTPAEETETTISWVAPETVTAVWDEENGTLTLTGVEGSEEPIVLNLTSPLRSLAFVPEVMAQGLGVISFYNVYDMDGVFATANQPKVTYRLNPQNANVASTEWSFICRLVQTRVAGDFDFVISVLGVEDGEEGGKVFEITSNTPGLPSDASATGLNVLTALRAETGDEEIVSDYALVECDNLDDLYLINKVKYETRPSAVVPFYSVGDLSDPAYDIYSDVPVSATENLALVYNSSLDVKKYLETYAGSHVLSLTEAYVYPEYSVELVDYLGTDGVTNQRDFVTLSEDGVLKVNSEWLSTTGRSAIGRTPVLYVQAKVGDQVLAHSYIKVMITDQSYSEVALGDFEYTLGEPAYDYQQIGANSHVDLTWQNCNAYILDVLGLSQAQFVARYDLTAVQTTYKVENAATFSPVAPAGISVNTTAISDPTATNAVSVVFDNTIDEDTYGVVKVTIPAYNNYRDKNIVLLVNYRINHTHSWPAFINQYVAGTDAQGRTIVRVKGKLVGGSFENQATLSESLSGMSTFNDAAGNHVAGTFKFAFVDPEDDENTVSDYYDYNVATDAYDIHSATITGSDYSDQEINLVLPITSAYRDYVLRMSHELANGNVCTKDYVVRFINPFSLVTPSVTLNDQATATTSELCKVIVVKDNYNNDVYKYNTSTRAGSVTTYGQTAYGLSNSDFSFDYEIDAPNFESSLTVDANGVITWSNGGTALGSPITASYKVGLTIANICEINSTGNVTVSPTL